MARIPFDFVAAVGLAAIVIGLGVMALIMLPASLIFLLAAAGASVHGEIASAARWMAAAWLAFAAAIGLAWAVGAIHDLGERRARSIEESLRVRNPWQTR